MQGVKAKRIKSVNWAQTLRCMTVGSELECSIEEKDSVTVTAIRLKREEDLQFSVIKNKETKIYTVTRLK